MLFGRQRFGFYDNMVCLAAANIGSYIDKLDERKPDCWWTALAT